MPQTSPRQRKTTGRVMHEFKHGELKSGRGGKGGKVRSRRQAIAIALKEAGASKYESKRKNKISLKLNARKRAARRTSRNARANRMSGRAASVKAAALWAARNATKKKARGKKAARSRARHNGDATKQTLYRRAKARGIEGRSKMSKRQLEHALH